jgi:hypothetical protein
VREWGQPAYAGRASVHNGSSIASFPSGQIQNQEHVMPASFIIR